MNVKVPKEMWFPNFGFCKWTIFAEVTVTATICLDMMEDYALSQVPQGYLIQQGGAPPHYT
jgi:hypothetical protein